MMYTGFEVKNIKAINSFNYISSRKIDIRLCLQCRKWNMTLKTTMKRIRNHQVCPQAVHMAEASSPSDWSGRGLCSHSRLLRSSWEGQNVPCRSSRSLCAGWPAIPICWCQRVQCQCTWTEDARADCGCCICLSSLLGDEDDSFKIWKNIKNEKPNMRRFYWLLLTISYWLATPKVQAGV